MLRVGPEPTFTAHKQVQLQIQGKVLPLLAFVCTVLIYTYLHIGAHTYI